MRIALPYPPTANHLTTVARGRKIKSKEAKGYTQRVYGEWLASGCPKLQAERYSVRIVVYPPDNRRRDLSNCEKVVVDSLVACGALPDDHRICRLLLVRGPVIEGGGVTVTARVA